MGELDVGALAADVGVCVAIVLVAAAVLERRRRRHNRFWRCSLSEVLAAMLLIAVPLGWLARAKCDYENEQAALARLRIWFTVKPKADAPRQWNYRSECQQMVPAWIERLVPLRWRTWFTRCQALAVNVDKVAGGKAAAFETLLAFKSLPQLTVSGASLDGSDMERLLDFKELTWVRVRSKSVGDAGALTRARCPRLTWLRLEHMRLALETIDEICQIPIERSLLLTSVPLADESVLKPAAAKQLLFVRLFGATDAEKVLDVRIQTL